MNGKRCTVSSEASPQTDEVGSRAGRLKLRDTGYLILDKILGHPSDGQARRGPAGNGFDDCLAPRL